MNESTNLVNRGYKLLENRIFNNLSVDVAKDYDLSTSLKTPLMMIQRGADKSNDTDTSTKTDFRSSTFRGRYFMKTLSSFSIKCV